jgi:hypothetical protein
MKQKLTRHEFWSGHIKSWKSGNLTQSEYCRKNKLDINLFSKWKRRNIKSGFVEVKTKVPEYTDANDFIEISVHDIYKIKVTRDFDNEALRKILNLLGGDR